MSDTLTKRLIRPFVELAPAPMFLSGFFVSPPENFHTSEEVEIDIQRDGEDVAVAIQKLEAAGEGRRNENSKYSNKKFTPPIFKETISLNGFQLLSRDPGDNPFADINYRAKAMVRMGRESQKAQNKVRRAIELMASQVFRGATLTLVDENGNAVYELDFQGKNTHFTNVPTTWDLAGSTGERLSDLAVLADEIRTHGRRDANVLVFGSSAFQRFIAGADVKAALERDRLGLGQLAPAKRGNGATFQGFVWVGNYRFEMWTYNGHYVHPETKAPTPYIATNDVLMLSQEARLDLTFGAIPQVAPPDPRAAALVPPRVMDSERGIDMTVMPWLSPDGQTLNASVSSRPLTIPTEIDSFGRLTVVVP